MYFAKGRFRSIRALLPTSTASYSGTRLEYEAVLDCSRDIFAVLIGKRSHNSYSESRLPSDIAVSGGHSYLFYFSPPGQRGQIEADRDARTYVALVPQPSPTKYLHSSRVTRTLYQVSPLRTTVETPPKKIISKTKYKPVAKNLFLCYTEKHKPIDFSVSIAWEADGE